MMDENGKCHFRRQFISSVSINKNLNNTLTAWYPVFVWQDVLGGNYNYNRSYLVSFRAVYSALGLLDTRLKHHTLYCESVTDGSMIQTSLRLYLKHLKSLENRKKVHSCVVDEKDHIHDDAPMDIIHPW